MQKNLISVLCIGAVAGLTGYMVRGLRFQPFRIFSLHKVFYPCNRCHLATLSDNQYVTCGNEVTRVATNGDFALNIHSTQSYRGTEFLLFLRVFVSPCSPKYCMGLRSPGLRGSKVPPPWVEGAASVGRRCRLHGSKVPPSWVEGTGFMTLGDYL